MNNNIQYGIVALLFVAALVYLFKTMRKSSKGEACESGSCKCEPGSKKVS